MHMSQMFVYIQIYIDIYVCVSLRGHNMGSFYARILKVNMLLTETLTINSVLELPLGVVGAFVDFYF